MLALLNSIFAFAVWDCRDRTVLLARDTFGVKPLYYAQCMDFIAFGSKIKGLLALCPNFREIDFLALHRYLIFLWFPGVGTPLKHVRKVLPGETLILRKGRATKKWSWYLPNAFRKIRPNLTEVSTPQEVTRHLRNAVQRQMVSDVPSGAFLSDGLDSRAFVYLAREVNPLLHCFTIEAKVGFDEGDAAHLPYAKAVSSYLEIPLTIASINAIRLADDLERMILQLDEPLAEPAALNVFYICKSAREPGVKVLLSGAGGRRFIFRLSATPGRGFGPDSSFASTTCATGPRKHYLTP